MSSPDTKREVARPKGNIHINAILAACESILAEGRRPSRDQHDLIIQALKGNGAFPNWQAFPLTQTWFTQI